MNNFIHWSPGVTLEALEKQCILLALQHFHRNKQATATALGIAIRTLDSRLEKYAAEDKAAEKADDQRKAERESALNRARGVPGVPQFDTNTPIGAKAHEGNGVESAPNFAQKPAMPVPQPKEIQGMLPGKAAGGGSRRSS